MRNRRVDRLENAVGPEEPFTFKFCLAPVGLRPEAHALWHVQRGEGMVEHFTLNLGNCNVSGEP
jgi:hypothetical protein